MRYLLCLIAVFHTILADTRAAEPFFKPNDVVALVGGEDMVVAAELGYLETLIQLALPDYHLKFRSLAREGDTVFEQRRDLNYPKLEDQLDKIGATVVICQFGQMESLAAGLAMDRVDRVDAVDKVDAAKGESAVHSVQAVQPVQEKADAARKAKVAEFVAAYEKLIARLSGGGKRRVAVVDPVGVENSRFLGNRPSTEHTGVFRQAVIDVARKSKAFRIAREPAWPDPQPTAARSKDGIHFNDLGHRASALAIAKQLVDGGIATATNPGHSFHITTATNFAPLAPLIAAKNRLWFHYYRPQNWAFLAGDRTNQPSSRDHLDPSKRWFPEELERFVPLIDAKDAEIWALAKKLAK